MEISNLLPKWNIQTDSWMFLTLDMFLIIQDDRILEFIQLLRGLVWVRCFIFVFQYFSHLFLFFGSHPFVVVKSKDKCSKTMGVNTKAGPMPHISSLLYRLLTMSHKLTAINYTYNTHLSKAKLTQLVQDEVPPLQLLLPGAQPGVSQLVLRHRNMVATVPWASCNNISQAN